MINVNDERAKVKVMKQVMEDIDDEVASLKKYTNDTQLIFSGNAVDDYINELIDNVKDLVVAAGIMSAGIEHINYIIDKVYQEEQEQYEAQKQKDERFILEKPLEE